MMRMPDNANGSWVRLIGEVLLLLLIAYALVMTAAQFHVGGF